MVCLTVALATSSPLMDSKTSSPLTDSDDDSKMEAESENSNDAQSKEKSVTTFRTPKPKSKNHLKKDDKTLVP
jgi:hypothetical protein